MADFTFDLGCLPPTVTTVEPRPSVGSTREQGHVRSREIGERPVRSVTYQADGVTLGEANTLAVLYAQTVGGVLPMDFSPPNGNPSYEVAFKPGSVRITQKTATSYTLDFTLEEVL